jgi:hypothetical protein
MQSTFAARVLILQFKEKKNMSIVKTTFSFAIMALVLTGCGPASAPTTGDAGGSSQKPVANTSASAASTSAATASTQASGDTPTYAPTGHYGKAPDKVLGGNLFEAAKSGDFDTVRALLSQGANPNGTNGDGETPLHAAASANHQQVAMLLIQKGGNVNATTTGGWTPLHSAARFGAFQVVSSLISNGANLSATNKDGRTPEDLARAVNNVRMASLIRYHTK